MVLPDRKVLLGVVLGAVCGAGLTIAGPGAVMGAIADETQTGIDPTSLVKFEGRDYDVQYEDWVDTEPTAKSRVKKIEFGRVSYIDITTTATGAYSTDAMFSVNIQYPGITVEPVSAQIASAVSVIGFGGHWVDLPLAPGNSFVYTGSGDHATISGNGLTCVFTQHSTGC
ncbi:hypothetical protein [uncultured Devosia sp.]|uniref:hypothetical protein n=1 Tax=uncultured Devosia sp. TaxID=211434 RepID=UPI0035C9E121